MKEIPNTLEVSDFREASFELNSSLPNVVFDMADCSSETKQKTLA